MSLPLDKLRKAPCVVTTEQDPTTCLPADGSGGGGDPDDPDVPPVDDDRCADPAFYDANPTICRGYPRLILKPEYVVKESGQTAQYSTFLRVAGNETLLSSGLAYSISDPTVAVIEAEDGLATAVGEGIATVSVTWQNLSAYAQFETVASCGEVNVNYFILIDNSASSKVLFGGGYATRLSYSKEAARAFVDSVDFSKDKVAVGYFNTAGTLVQEVTDDADDAKAAIAGITSTDALTDIAAGLQVAFNHLDESSERKCVILFSDGENKSGEDPRDLANTWKEGNKTVMVVALRAWGIHFDLLYRIASSGFFLSAYNDTATTVIDTLKQLKSYFCSADCSEEPGTYPMAELNYTGFVNWDVFQGHVDLVGLGLWDVLPGNGLYVDLAGTKDDVVPSGYQAPGGLVSKEEFSVVLGQEYSFSIDVAGNNVGRSNENEKVKVTIYHEDDDTIELEEEITPTGYADPFDTFPFAFTATKSGDVKIKIEMIEDDSAPAGADKNNVGPLIDNVLFRNTTTDTTILDDDFNDENPTTIPPGYTYYGGCITSPPGAQVADPTPPSADTEVTTQVVSVKYQR